MLRSLRTMIESDPDSALAHLPEPQNYFDVIRAMLFYVDEFPERLHHPKESDLLFPRVARMAPDIMETVVWLEQDHARSEADVRKLQHLLLAWELLGDGRRADFVQAAHDFIDGYQKHMLLEETVILPAAIRVMNDADWGELDAAFMSNNDPLSQKSEPDLAYERLFKRIVIPEPTPISVE